MYEELLSAIGVFFNCRLPDEVRVRWELVMTSKVQTADDRLHQLADDAADLVRKFAELAMLRELVEETESALGIKRASHKRSTPTLPTKSRDPSDHHRAAG